ncbi:MAG: DNA polymerase III subunit gamma/tau [Proteobacteria bacterium]|nr:DNA polymerase III subunit gamma/tau [Pseudomonadota bacterium]
MASESSEYKVLARKYRPKTFDQLIGQDVMVRTLKNAIQSKRLAHAFILTGVRGVGKTTTARLLASTLNCLAVKKGEEMAASPCGSCENCLEIAESRHPDVLEMDAASRTSVDDVREIIENVRYAPSSARFKVYIIDEVHMLSKNAFNALLKTLEEPPPHVKFIFATTEIRKLPVTVLSRCQRFDLRRVPTELLVKHLTEIKDQEKCQVEDEAILMIARAAEGSVRDGLSLLDQAIAHGGGAVSAESVRTMLGLADRLQILVLFRTIMAGKVKEALAMMAEQYTLGADPAVIIKDLVETSHWITRIKTTGEAGLDALISEPERNEGTELAKALSLADLTRAWQILLKGFEETGFAPSPIRAAEMVVIRLCHAARLPDPAKLVKSLTAKEEQEVPAREEAPPAATPEKVEATTKPEPREDPGPKASSPPTASGGAQVLALAPEATGEGEPLTPMPQSFAGLVSLFEQKHEGVIGKYLFDDVSLVSFRPGAVSFNPVRKIPATLPSRMKDILETWTGQKWQITLANETGEPPLKDQEDRRNAELDQQARNHPLVQKALKAFPGAKITKIKKLDNEEDRS